MRHLMSLFLLMNIALFAVWQTIPHASVDSPAPIVADQGTGEFETEEEETGPTDEALFAALPTTLTRYSEISESLSHPWYQRTLSPLNRPPIL